MTVTTAARYLHSKEIRRKSGDLVRIEVKLRWGVGFRPTFEISIAWKGYKKKNWIPAVDPTREETISEDVRAELSLVTPDEVAAAVREYWDKIGSIEVPTPDNETLRRKGTPKLLADYFAEKAEGGKE